MSQISSTIMSRSQLHELWEELSEADRVKHFKELSYSEAQDFFLKLDAEDKAAILLELDQAEQRLWLRSLDPDDAADVIQETPEEKRSELLEMIDLLTRNQINALLAYAEDVAGGLMSPRYVRVRPEMISGEAIRYVRKQALEKVETIYYIYVLGHELTHVLFVVIFRGKVTDFHVSTAGGFITTDKTNLIIALSPYFMPFWAVVCALLYGILKWCMTVEPVWDLVFYGVMGVSWTFHMVWTLWMIPRDQPDLTENGTFLSLVVIFLANLLVLVGLLCVAAQSPAQDLREFAMEWLRVAATWGDAVWRALLAAVAQLRTAGKF